MKPAGLPPGPRQPSTVQLLEWALRPERFMRECQQRYGDVFTIHLRGLGPEYFVMLSSPEQVKQVFTGDPDVLRAGEANAILEPLVGARSVLLLDGPPHLRQRRLLLPPMHGERMHAYAELMRDITDDSLDRWPIASPVSVHERMQAITLDVILRAVFGVEEGAGMRELAKLLVEFFTPPPALLAFLPIGRLDWPGLPYRKFLQLRARVDEKLYALIRQRRQAKDLASRTDILSLLMQARDEDGQAMTEEELRDELATMIAAGHETTATALSWAFERVLADRAVLERIHAELDAVVGDGPLEPEHLPRLEYVDAVVKETLRLRPIIPLVGRRLSRPWTVGEWTLPAGVVAAPCIWLVHRRPELYPDPERFLPERFLGKKPDPYEWLPFGGGVRRCLGMAFALYEAKTVLATVLLRARLRLAKPAPLKMKRRSITFAPDGGTPVVVMERAPRRQLLRRVSA